LKILKKRKFLFVVLSISLGASIGALFRWYLGMSLNSFFPTIPLGTLACNLIGGFLMGIFMAVTKDHKFISETARLAVATGFLGSLTTFSTFSAETVNLLSHQQYIWSFFLIMMHVAGTILSTIFGLYVVKFLT
jgi:CrcB protein